MPPDDTITRRQCGSESLEYDVQAHVEAADQSHRNPAIFLYQVLKVRA